MDKVDIIKVRKKNHAYLYVEASPSVMNELTDFFTFYVPGYKFMPSYKNKMWDGKIRLYDSRTRELYSGLFKYLQEFANAEGREYSIEVEHDSYYGYPGSIDGTVDMSFIDKIPLASNGKVIKARDYQIRAVQEGLQNKQSMLISPTGSGKSLIIYLLIRYYLENNDKKILVIVPTTSLVQQMCTDFKDYATFDKSFDSDELCHMIYSGKEKLDLKKLIIVSTWQSIYKLPQQWFSQFGAVFGDEAHNFKAKSLTSILTKMKDAEYRFGTTGTLDGAQCFDGNTLIHTIDGKKKIKDISVKDKVLTVNEDNHSLEYKSVLNNFNNGISKKMLKIKTITGEVIVTHDHEIYTKDGWKKARDLTLEDEIICIN